MSTYTVHVPSGVADDAARADDTVFVREGFAWGAFLLGPLALLYRGLWRAALVWAAAAAALLAVAVLCGLGFGPRLVLYLVLAVLAGLEAADARRAALGRAGFIPAALVSAASRGEAERLFFAGAAPLLQPAPTPPGSTGGRGGRGGRGGQGGPGTASRARPVVGLFPSPGGRA